MKFSVNDHGDFRRFNRQISEVDMDKVKEEGVRRAAEELASRVRDNVSADDRIDSPSQFHSDYRPDPRGRSPGPSMVHPTAWLAEPAGNGEYRVSPHPSVRQRATYLEYGSDGPITAKGDKKMKFYVDGVPTYREEVSGYPAHGFWRGAIREMQAEERLEHHLEEALTDELREAGLI